MTFDEWWNEPTLEDFPDDMVEQLRVTWNASREAALREAAEMINSMSKDYVFAHTAKVAILALIKETK